MRTSRMATLAMGLASLWLLTPSALAHAGGSRGINPDLYAGLKWRDVGPFHGGRIAAVAGVVGEPGVYYFGAAQGGIWKTTDAGVTWRPVFDQVRSVDSIGAVAVAPSNPDIVYAGTGDPITLGVTGTLGDGMWKSDDAGKTWHHIGLANTVKIDRILVDPANPDLVIASTLGDAKHHGGGIYRSTDGGRTWTNVLKPAGYAGTREVEFDYSDPKVMLADTQGNGNPFLKAKKGHKTKPPLLFKSTDEGKTWHRLKIPPFKGRIAVWIASHTHGQRIYLISNNIEHGSGLFRSDDGGASWKHMAGKDTRISNGQGSYSSGVFVDPQNPDVVYTFSTAMYRSTDGGVTFHAFKGAPGGEDYHKLWIDPDNGKRMIVGTDQGASVTLNGGRSWSLWYTQPIAQIYHLATTAQYPYSIVGSQQDTGAVMVKSRGKWGQLDITDWSPVPSSEFGIITPDPLHPDILYGVGYGPGGGGDGVTRINMHTGQWQNIAPNFGVDAHKYRESRDAPKAFDTVFDPHALYAAYQCLLVTHDGGHSWKVFSPDLTTPKGKPQVACGTPMPHPKKDKKAKSANPFHHGPDIDSFSISKVKRGVFWTVSSTGQIYRTADDGKHWVNVSNIGDAPAHTHLLTIEAGDTPGTAYVTGRVYVKHGFRTAAPVHGDADIPLIWRTTDGGKTWVKIVAGLPRDQLTGSWVNVVRAAPGQPGLLFAGTETTVFVSFDNGAHWQSLRQNLPSTSIRDMVVHTAYHMNDLVICTYGRGFWVLDDITPLRQIAAHARAIETSAAYLFKPEQAIRSRKNSNWDQPFSVEVPHAHNPPYGVIVDYYLRHHPHGTIHLQVFDGHGNLVRSMTSKLPKPVAGQAYPRYWLAPPQSRALSTHVGLNRVSWDLRYAPPPAFQHDLENQMNTVADSVTRGPHGPQVIPGVYTLKLTVDGHSHVRHVTVENDPRVGQGPQMMAALKAQNRLSMLAYHGMIQTYEGRQEVHAVESELDTLMHGSVPGDVAAQAKKLKASLDKIGGGKPLTGILAYFKRMRARKPGAMLSFLDLNDKYNDLVSMMQVGYDMSPTPTQVATWSSDCRHYRKTVAAWKALQTHQLSAFNSLLAKKKLPGLSLSPVKLDMPSCHFAP